MLKTINPLKEPQADEKAMVSVVGCERMGMLHTCLLADAGFKVLCVDNDRALIERFSKGKAPFLNQEIEPTLQKGLENKRIRFSYNIEDAAESEIILFTTPAVVSERGTIDYSGIEKMFKKIGSNIRKNTLIVNMSVVGIGVNESVLKKTVEDVSGFRVGVDIFFAYCPVPFPEKQTLRSLMNYRRVVAAQDRMSLEKASNVVGSITKAGLAKSLDFKVAEAAVLFETVYRNVRSALSNEFAAFCEKIGADYLAIHGLIAADADCPHKNFWSFGGEEALLMLFEEADNQNVKLKVSQTVLELKKELVKRKVSLIQDALKSCGKTMRRAKITVLGVSQTQNAADLPESSFKDFVKMLERKGARPSVYDPYLQRKASGLDLPYVEENLSEALDGADCIIIYTGHEQFRRLNLRKVKLLANTPAAIVDFEGVLEPAKVEAEGFTYRGLGRGVWRK
jgi:nucleotide sugar dehydrogenase